MSLSIKDTLGMVAETILYKTFSKVSFLDKGLGLIMSHKPTELLSKSLTQRVTRIVGEVAVGVSVGEGKDLRTKVRDLSAPLQRISDGFGLGVSINELVDNPAKVVRTMLRTLHKAEGWDAVKDFAVSQVSKQSPRFLGGSEKSLLNRVVAKVVEKALSWSFAGMKEEFDRETVEPTGQYTSENILARILHESLPLLKSGEASWPQILGRISNVLQAIQRERVGSQRAHDDPMAELLGRLGIGGKDRVEEVLKDFSATPLTNDVSNEELLKQILLQYVVVDSSSGDRVVKTSDELRAEIGQLDVSEERRKELLAMVDEFSGLTPLSRQTVFVTSDPQTGTTHVVASSFEQVSTLSLAPEGTPLVAPPPPPPAEEISEPKVSGIDLREDLSPFARELTGFVESQTVEEQYTYTVAKGFETTLSDTRSIIESPKDTPSTLYRVVSGITSTVVSSGWNVLSGLAGWWWGASPAQPSTQPPVQPPVQPAQTTTQTPPAPTGQPQPASGRSWFGAVTGFVSSAKSLVSGAVLAGGQAMAQRASGLVYATANVVDAYKLCSRSHTCSKLVQACGGNTDTFTRLTGFMTPECVRRMVVDPSKALIDPETNIMTINGEQYKLGSTEPRLRYEFLVAGSKEKPFVQMMVSAEWDVLEYKKTGEESWHRASPDTLSTVRTSVGVLMYQNPSHGKTVITDPTTTAGIILHNKVTQ